MVRFEGVTVYKSQFRHKLINAFDQATYHGTKTDAVGAFYPDLLTLELTGDSKGKQVDLYEAIVLDGEDYDRFTQMFNTNPHGRPGSKDHRAYRFEHPSDYSHYAIPIQQYIARHPLADASGNPFVIQLVD